MARRPAAPALRRIVAANGLSLTLLALFLTFWVGQALVGRAVFNEEQRAHGGAAVGIGDYLASNHFLEATFENWESEFLQMAAYVLLTVFLVQRGSAESNPPPGGDPRARRRTPWAVRRGGWIRRLYEHSLSLAFLLLFLASFLLHGISGLGRYNDEQAAHGLPPISLPAYLATAQFWFESFQNWQSEFLAIASMVVLSIFLREKGSPESKDVEAPHSHTGA